jgi:L-fuculose-phosphate aldolase
LSRDAEGREQLCEIGRRMYARGFASASDGNLSCRLDDSRVLCTPSLICKGFMRPDDLCVVDLDGNPLEGRRRRTSEILLHLEIYRRTPQARAVVHAHPPHATAFAITGQDLPSGILAEVELFLGVVPRAPYETPGGPRCAQSIAPFVEHANTVLLASHGSVSWADALERAFWQTEILDAYCRTLLLAQQLGPIERLPEDKLRELLALRPNFGVAPDPRLGGALPLYVNPGFGR